jgi:uncharacterized protein (DUF4415 family)
MARKERIVRYTAKELKAMRAKGKSLSDWPKAKAMSQRKVNRLADEEDGCLPEGWERTVMIGLPPGKEAIKLRVDRDVLGWFKGTGKGYQTRMNNVLRAFVSSRLNVGSAFHIEKR